MIKRIEIYKKDKWNMMHVDVKGTKIVLTEISEQWGEESHQFIGRSAMWHWVEQRFLEANYEGREQEWRAIMDKFNEI